MKSSFLMVYIGSSIKLRGIFNFNCFFNAFRREQSTVHLSLAFIERYHSIIIILLEIMLEIFMFFPIFFSYNGF